MIVRRQKMYFFGMIDVLEKFTLRWRLQRMALRRVMNEFIMNEFIMNEFITLEAPAHGTQASHRITLISSSKHSNYTIESLSLHYRITLISSSKCYD